MRLKHWSVRYARDRFAVLWHGVTNPGAPWLVPHAVAFLEMWLEPSDNGFEWGAGASTTWLGNRVRRLTSVEYDTKWFSRVSRKIDQLGIGNVELVYHDLWEDRGSAYVRVIEEKCPDESLDFCLVDGRLRDQCAKGAVPKIRPGGLLILDNADRYLPSRSATPDRRDDYESQGWESFDNRLVGDWRCLWFSSGITATAIWVKPSHGSD